MKTDHYIYCYFRPNGQPCYIGKGSGRRWKEHLKRSCNSHLQRIIDKAGGEIPFVKLQTGLTHEQAIAYEIAWIKALGRGKYGALVNHTYGGDGSTGWIPSDDTREKMRKSHIGKIHSAESKEKRSNALKGRPGPKQSAETRAKKSAANRGRKLNLSPEERLRRKNMWLGKSIPAEMRAKISAALRGRTIPEEVRKKISAAGKGRKFSAEHKAKISAAMFRSHHKRQLELTL